MAGYTGQLEISYLVNSQFSRAMPRNQGIVGQFNIEALEDIQFEGARASGGAVFPPPAPTDGFTGMLPIVESPGLDWFDRVHILPRTPIDFGNIVTSDSAEYELFSAWREDITLMTITNNVGAGVTLPDMPAVPDVLPSFTSYLDAASVRLIKVKTTVDVSADGAPRFDGTIDFLFDTAEEPFLTLTGSRIALITPEYEDDYQERWSFLTDIIDTVSGKEQRIALRRNPRQELLVTYRLDAEERQRMLATLFGWQSKLFAVPLWGQTLRTTAAASATDTTVQVNTTTNFDFRVDGLAVIYESPTKFDVLVLSAVAANTLTFTTSPLLNSYSTNAKVMPVRLAYITNIVRGDKFKTKLEDFQIAFVVLDNDTGAPTESTSGWNTHGGKILLDDGNLMDSDTIPEEFRQLVTFVDNDTGVFSTSTRWSRHKRASQKGFACHSRAEILKLRKLLLAFNGRQKSWWLPTFSEDMTVVATLNSGTSTMDISHIGYARFVVGGVSPRDTIRVTFTDGTSLVRTISSSTEVSSTVERLTLNTTWPANRTTAEIRRVEYLELSRFDSDTFVFQFKKVNTAFVVAPVIAVFD